MSISRRKFLKAGAFVAVSAAVPLNIFAGEALSAATSKPNSIIGGMNPTNALSTLTSEVFSRHLNTKFSLLGDNAKSLVTLIEIRHWQPGKKNGTASNAKECFSLVFRGDEKQALRQNTYSVTHASLGTFDLFLVPARSGKQAPYYEALFNRLQE